MDDLGRLLLNRGNHTRMRMPGISDGNAGGEIHVPLTVDIPDVDTLAAIDKDWRIASNDLRNELLRIEGDVLGYHDRSFLFLIADDVRERIIPSRLFPSSLCNTSWFSEPASHPLPLCVPCSRSPRW